MGNRKKKREVKHGGLELKAKRIESIDLKSTIIFAFITLFRLFVDNCSYG